MSSDLLIVFLLREIILQVITGRVVANPRSNLALHCHKAAMQANVCSTHPAQDTLITLQQS